jgi:hypothetical protein
MECSHDSDGSDVTLRQSCNGERRRKSLRNVRRQNGGGHSDKVNPVVIKVCSDGPGVTTFGRSRTNDVILRASKFDSR